MGLTRMSKGYFLRICPDRGASGRGIATKKAAKAPNPEFSPHGTAVHGFGMPNCFVSCGEINRNVGKEHGEKQFTARHSSR